MNTTESFFFFSLLYGCRQSSLFLFLSFPSESLSQHAGPTLGCPTEMTVTGNRPHRILFVCSCVTASVNPPAYLWVSVFKPFCGTSRAQGRMSWSSPQSQGWPADGMELAWGLPQGVESRSETSVRRVGLKTVRFHPNLENRFAQI